MAKKIPKWQRALLRLRRRFGGEQFLAGGATIAGILLLTTTVRNWLGSMLALVERMAENRTVVTLTLVANLALILLAWRRFQTLSNRVAAHEKAEAEAQHLAKFDPLTGFYTRSAFYAAVPDEVLHCTKNGGTPAMLIVNMDAFKSINDLFGHARGDEVLTITAERITASIPRNAVKGRIGGDEFAIFIPLVAGGRSLAAYGALLADVLSHPISIEGMLIATSSSIGGALPIDANSDFSSLMRQADTAVQHAKSEGRGRYIAFDHQMHSKLQHRDEIERQIHLGLGNGEFRSVYAPVVDLNTGRIHGYEMLPRWHSETLGEVDPATFMAVAEDAGLVTDVSMQLMRHAMTDAAQWPASQTLSVNAPPTLFQDPWFAHKLLQLLAETGFAAKRLVVEVTERAIVGNPDLVQTIFTSLHNQGIRLALDDFGTGYSSVSSLRNMPFDWIKLDAAFVASTSRDHTRRMVADAVLQLGRSMGLPVIAQGVESESAAQLLAQSDCAMGQGPLYGPPVSQSEIMARVTSEKSKNPPRGPQRIQSA